ncbi:MAG: hypothetical protein OXI16_13810 [Chloroflexota bacterium]|nr:hypothetical protein [Chloroflexota bacterium]
MVQVLDKTETVTTLNATAPRRRRKSGKKATATQAPVDADGLPEFKEALKWADEVRAKAEAQIARETSEIPQGVINRLRSLMNGGWVSKRQFEIVSAWNGVGARGRRPGEGDYHAIRETMKALALLPTEGADVGKWWVTHAMPDDEQDKTTKIGLHCLYPKHYLAHSYSALGLKDALRNALKSMLNDIPSSSETYAWMKERRADSGAEARSIPLSEVVRTVNKMEGMRSVVQNTNAAHTPVATGVESVKDDLLAAGIDGFAIDCGQVSSAEQVRDAIAEYENRVRGCARCSNWFTVDADKVKYDWYNRCPECSSGWIPHISIGGHGSYEQGLVSSIDSWTKTTIDLAPKVAIAEGTTLDHARQLLGVDGHKGADATDGLETCPMAADCDTLCGRLQASGERLIPLTPENGQYASCHLYGFMQMAKGADEETREKIAKSWARQIKNSIRGAAEQQEIMPQAELTPDTAKPNPMPKVSVQHSLF